MNFCADTNPKNRIRFLATSFSIFFATFFVLQSTVHAENIDYSSEMLRQKELPIQSNSIQGWPEGPAISSQAAILMDANTKTILYSKNIDEKLYPASTTKIMTCLLAVENAKLDEQIVFSHDAVFSVPNDGSNLGIDEGESIPLEEALYGIMVGSANEVANAVAEHVGGSMDKFVDMMNARAKELGCKNTHFANANGIQNENHYTTAYDLALISAEYFSNDLLCKVGNTPSHHFIATETQPDEFFKHNKHRLITGEIKYDGILGGKTGYTDLARETLVTCAERDGMKLICVVLKTESPEQFNDTVTLFNYGFNNFRAEKVADIDKRYMPNDSLFFESDNDVFGKSGTILSLNKNDYIILPVNASVEDTDYDISYDLSPAEQTKAGNVLAKVIYNYNGTPIGSARVCFLESEGTPSQLAGEYHSIYINVKILILSAGLFVIFMTAGSFVVARIAANRTFHSRSDRIRYNRRKREFNKGHIQYKKIYIIVAVIVIAIICFGLFIFFNSKSQKDTHTKNTDEIKPEAPVIEESADNMDVWKENHLKVKGIYVTGPTAGTDKLDDIISLINETELNTIVLDVKDDNGNITFKMDNENVIEMNSGIAYIKDISTLLKKLKENDIYVIARIACFKDPILAKAHPELALTSSDNTPITDANGNAWVNPCKEEVWDYIISLVDSCCALGFDEVQLDYVRFPVGQKADDALYDLVSDDDDARRNYITEFLAKVTEEGHKHNIPVSADVFGTIINSNKDSRHVGQDYVNLVSNLDIICPMIYPSHYANGEFKLDVPDAHPYDTVHKALEKSNEILKPISNENHAVIRPWLQAFTATWVKGHIKYEGEEIRAQIQAVYDCGYDEWILWNSNSNYNIDALTKS